MKYTINSCKYIKKTSKYIGVFKNTFIYHLHTIKIHFHTLIYIEIISKNLTYLWHMLQCHYFNILPYTLNCSTTSLFHISLSFHSIIFQNCLGTSLFYKNVLALAIIYLLESNTLSIVHEFHKSHWSFKYLNS
jgi:hypothetical protein